MTFQEHEQKRQAIERSYLEHSMSIEIKDKMIAVVEQLYRKSQIESGLLDSLFEIRTIDEVAKAAAVADCDNRIATIPALDWAAYGLKAP